MKRARSPQGGAPDAGEGVATPAGSLSPVVADWFIRRHGAFTHAQELAIPRILRRESVLVSSPTGSGKTLAGFLGIIDFLAREHAGGKISEGIRAIYVSPLRALTYDIEKNLTDPLLGIGLEKVIKVGRRTGDSTAAERARIRRTPPHILLTTPESLAILLAQAAYREALARCEFAVIDELHALAENKRGAHLSVSLERLERFWAAAGRPALCRVGLSATVAPLNRVAEFLAGADRPCQVVEARSKKRVFIEVMTPLRREPYPPSGYTASRVIGDLAKLVERKRSTIVFCNTRSGAENVSHRLKLALPKLADAIETHHASLDRDVRREVEDRLKNGELRAVVCSTSLELGIDIGAIDTVVMISTPKGVSRTLQRVGRSGHSVHEDSHGILVATNINDLIECVVCSRMAKNYELDPVRILGNASDVLCQHVVGMAMEGDVSTDEAYATVVRSGAFHTLTRPEFDRVVRYLEGGGKALETRYRETFGKIKIGAGGMLEVADKKVGRDYLVNVGTIHADGMVRVYLGKRRLGEVEEGFIKGIKIGDTFVLGGKVVRLEETGVGEARVSLARDRLPTVPTWNANKMPLASGLADAVSALRGELARKLEDPHHDRDEVREWLVERYLISDTNAEAVVRHFENQRILSEIPTDRNFLIEFYRGADGAEEGGQDSDRIHFFFHTLIGRSANDALSRIIAYRLKRAVGGNALATIDDYGFLLTVRGFQELELEGWRALFHPGGAEDDLRAALHGSQLVKWQFRGVAQTGLMVPRNLPGKERQLRQLRWSAEILFRVLEEREPDHPLLAQTYQEAMHTFLDTHRALDLLERAQGLEWKMVEVPAVTPFAFGLYASKIKESMMMESPEEAIERLYQTFQHRTASSRSRSPEN